MEAPAVRRYRPTRSWPVGGLALAAAAGAVLSTGTLSSTLGGGPDPAFAARIGQSVARAGPGMEARAAALPAMPVPAAVPAAAAAAPPPAPQGVWQIQVGAFRDTSAAEAHLRALEAEVPELGGLTRTHQLRGRINRVRIGGIANKPAARALCERILAVGRGCFVARPEGRGV